ncbi:MAG: alpha/beta fold hydrolase [Actinomycetes bacterium]
MTNPAQNIELPHGRTLQVTEAGDPSGVPVVVHHGAPGSSLLDPAWHSDAVARGLRLISYARPGYGTSSRHRGRVVADAAADVAALADALGIARFLSWGVSGGGPHVLATAALLPERVVAAASLASAAPFDAEGLDFYAGMGQGNIDEFGIVVECGEDGIRPLAEQQAAQMSGATREQMVEAMAPHLTEVDARELSGPIGATLHAAFADGLAVSVDGWIDDDLAFVQPWGFAPAAIGVPVLLWQGRQDAMVPFGHGEWLAKQIPGVDARLTEAAGPLTLLTRRIPEVHQWLRDQWDARA